MPAIQSGSTKHAIAMADKARRDILRLKEDMQRSQRKEALKEERREAAEAARNERWVQRM